jgi:hypothetical protein
MILPSAFKKMTDDERLQASLLGLRGIIVHGRDGHEIPMIIQGPHDAAQEFADRMNRRYVRGIDREDLFCDLEKIYRGGC